MSRPNYQNNQEDSGANVGPNLKYLALLVGLAFAVTLAVMIGKRMSTEAMAVVIGIVCGVAASIPTTALLVLVLTRRERHKEEETARYGRQGSYPPVVVIQGGAPQSMLPGPQAGYWPAPPSGPPSARQFTVVGGDELDVGE